MTITEADLRGHQELWYYEPERDITDTIREAACTQCIHILGYIDLLSRWEAIDDLRWWLEDIFGHLFGIWWENTPQSLKSAVDGELPLHCIGEWERSHIINFDDLMWECVEPSCGCECATHEAEFDGHCPDCGDGSLFLKF
jgi:hypothetical protein